MRRRAVADGVLSGDECRELIFVQRALAVMGYRPHVCSLTLHELLHAQPALLVPLVRARHKVWMAVEEQLGVDALGGGAQQGLFVETTSLIAWEPGASLGWHTDDNQPYLRARHVSAVLYLNDGGGADFSGGDFMFRDKGVIVPATGKLVSFLATEEHCVAPVLSGERHALTMWFTRDLAACEDAKVLRQLPDLAAPGRAEPAGLPDTMYLLAGGDAAQPGDAGAAGAGQGPAEQRDVRLLRLRRWGLPSEELRKLSSWRGSPHVTAPSATGHAGLPAARAALTPTSQAWVASSTSWGRGVAAACLRGAFALWMQQGDGDEADLQQRCDAWRAQQARRLDRMVADSVACGFLLLEDEEEG